MKNNNRTDMFSADLLQGPIFRNLVIFAIPLLISYLFQQLYNTVDTMIVGHFLGETSLAAIGSCTAIYDFLVGFGLGIGNGLAIVAARSFGAGDTDRLKKSVAGSVVIGLLSSAGITLFGSLLLRPLLQLLQTPDEIFEEAYSYISMIALFVVVMFAYNLLSALLRAIGNSFIPLLFLVFSSVLNVVLDIFFIVHLQQGVRGAAIATVIAQGVSALLCLLYILKCTDILVPEPKHFAVDGALYAELAAQGYSMGFMSCIVSAGTVILQYGINGLGTVVIAGHTAVRRIFLFSCQPLSAMGMAASTFVSQNRGADYPARIRRCLWDARLFGIVYAAAATVIMVLFAEPLIVLISGSDDPVVQQIGRSYMLVCTPFYAVLGTLLSTRFALQGLGQKILPVVSSVIECLGKVVFTVLLVPRFGYTAVVWCEPVIWSVMTVQLVIAFYTDPYVRAAKGKPLET